MDALLAKHAFNPFNKFKYIIKALSKLDKAVESSPYNLETRFIRFSVLHNLPGVFDIDEKRQQDLKIIITLLLKENYSDVDKSLQKGIAEFMLESKRLNEYQIIQLKRLMSNLAFNE